MIPRQRTSSRPAWAADEALQVFRDWLAGTWREAGVPEHMIRRYIYREA